MEKKDKDIVEAIQKAEEFDIRELFLRAIEKDASVDTLERLMKIREDIKKENAKEEFYRALGEFQTRLKPIQTDSVVKNKDGSIRYRYASLKKIMTEIQPLLTELGFSISFQTKKLSDREIEVICILKHYLGHSESSSFVIPIERSEYMNDIQKMGSTLTYAKRYALMGVLNITTEDTDTDANEVIVQETKPVFKISDNQRRYIFSLCKQKGISNEKRKEILKELLGIDSLNDISSREDFKKLLTYLKEYKNTG
ncbi:MAG TPA: ERF family protein [Defluviitoga tunisiensis]|nr:ERF family protein [bacterium]HPP10230.1 ERF family protein [Defluviitoga tunisiensis]